LSHKKVMATRNDILNELESISPVVAKVPFVNPFQVPQGYFDGFAEQVMMGIKADGLSAKEELQGLSPLLSGLEKKLPYEAPVGYFSELSEHAVAGVKAIEIVNMELENLSPVMNKLKTVNVYEAPEGYFDSLADNVLKIVEKRRTAKVIPMGRKIMRLAVAAVVAGLIAIGAWMYFGSGKPAASIASIENKVKQVSEDEMLNFLETDAQVVPESTMNNSDQIDEADMKSMLANVSDEKLEQFANDNSNTILSN